MSKEKIERNKEILAKHRLGMTYLELASEYGISMSRIRQIIQKEQAYQLSKPYPILEIKQACDEFGAPDGMHFRILNALHKERVDIRNRWKKLTKSDMLSIWGIGQQAADILVRAQEIAEKGSKQ